MSKMVTIQMPKEDIEAFLRVVDEIRFIKEAEKGDKEIDEGKFKTLDQIRKKYNIHS